MEFGIQSGIQNGIRVGKKYPDVGHGVFSIPNLKFSKELENVISVANSRAYELPTKYQLKIIDNHINELIANKIWSKLDSFFIFGTGSLRSYYNGFTSIGSANGLNRVLQFNLIDLKNPNRIAALTQVDNSPWMNQAGLQNNTNIVADGHLNTNYYPGASGNNWQQNNASFCVTISRLGDQSANNTNGQQIVSLTDSGAARRVASFVPRSTTDTTTGNINRSNNGAEVTFIAAGVSEQGGNHSLDRTASNLTTYYKDGASVATSAQASGTVPNNYPIVLLAQNIDLTTFTEYRRAPVSIFSAGASLGASLQKINHQIIASTISKFGYK